MKKSSIGGGCSLWPRSSQQDRARARRSSDPLRPPVPARRWSIAERRRRSASPTRRRAPRPRSASTRSIGRSSSRRSGTRPTRGTRSASSRAIRSCRTRLRHSRSRTSSRPTRTSSALVGPAGSQEVQDTAAVFKSGGLAIVTGSATRVTLTRAQGGNPRDTPKGFFYRTVPNDGQQGDRVRVLDHEEAEDEARLHHRRRGVATATGLADQVQRDLQSNGGLTVNARPREPERVRLLVGDHPHPGRTRRSCTSRGSSRGRPSSSTRSSALRGRKRSCSARTGRSLPARSPARARTCPRSRSTTTAPLLKKFKAQHGGQDEAFGLPTYTAALVNATAIMKACKNGTASRAEVRKNVANVKLSKKASLLGFPVDVPEEEQGRAAGPRRHGRPRRLRDLQDRRRREVQPRRLR